MRRKWFKSSALSRLLAAMCLTATLSIVQAAEVVVLEDAEDGLTDGWVVFDDNPAGASFSNVADSNLGSNVIETSGAARTNGYRLGGVTETSGGWGETGKPHISWRMRSNESFNVFVSVMTDQGFRYLFYNQQSIDRLMLNGTTNHHGLGSELMNDQWHTVVRDLQSDLEDGEPGIQLVSVNGISIRGSLRLDDVSVSDEAPVNNDPQAQAGSDVQVAQGASVTLDGSQSTDPDGVITGWQWQDANGSLIGSTEVVDWTPTLVGVNSVTLTVTDDAGGVDTDTLDVTIESSLPPFVVLEDGEDGQVDGWTVFDADPAGASFSNVTDELLDSQVIETFGAGRANGYRLGGVTEATGGWVLSDRRYISWRMRSSESFNVFVSVMTDQGFRYLFYNQQSIDRLMLNGTTNHHGLGSELMNDQWHTVVRDLQSDLEDGEPGIQLVSVNGISIRGSLRLDDVSVSDEAPVNNDPQAQAGSDVQVAQGASVTLDGSQSTDPDGVITSWQWQDATGSVIGSNEVIDWTPTLVGVNSVTLTVTDDAGGVDTDTLDVTVESSLPPFVVLEDGEDGQVYGWTVFDADPAGASFSNVTDEILGSQVIEITGAGRANGYRLGGVTEATGGWVLSDRRYISWRMRSSESFNVFVSVMTDQGFRYLFYNQQSIDRLMLNGTTNHHGLGSELMNGQWHTVVRDLQSDLEDGEPGIQLVSVNGISIRGSLRLDDVSVSDVPPVNSDPQAQAGSDVQVAQGASVTLDGSQSTDTDGVITGWQWQDGAGSMIGSTEVVSWTPTQVGVNTISLTVTDDAGGVDTDTLIVESLPSAPDLSNYTVVFEDDFTGTSLNPAKWDTSLLWGPYLPINGEEQMYIDTLGMHSSWDFSPFSFTGDTLKITAVPVSSQDPVPPRPAENDPIWKPRYYSEYDYNAPDGDGPGYNPDDVNYLSGIITSYDSLKFTHGYIETRVKLPAGNGLWPAFWTLGSHYVEDSPEIDVMEFLGEDVSQIYHTYHYFDTKDNWKAYRTPSFATVADDWTTDFHTFGMEWTPREIVWYVDGAEVRRVTDADYKISNQAMYLLANLAVGGSWPVDPDETTPFPAVYEIDYIRAYKRNIAEPVDLAADFQLMFQDEFNGSTLDPDKWATHFLWGPYLEINNEEQYYVDALGSDADKGYTPFEVSNGTLKIRAEAASDTPNTLPPLAVPDINDPLRTEYPTWNWTEVGDYEPANYTSGIITSYNSFKFVNGYAEIKARIPAGDGLWPAFWLLNGYYVGWLPEIDIMEVRGENPQQIVHSYHRNSATGVQESDSYLTEVGTYPVGASDGFHTYGVHWQPGKITWYIDGVAGPSLEDPRVGYQIMYVIANLAVGGDFNFSPVDPAAIPASFEIDYIRVYQMKD